MYRTCRCLEVPCAWDPSVAFPSSPLASSRASQSDQLLHHHLVAVDSFSLVLLYLSSETLSALPSFVYPILTLLEDQYFLFKYQQQACAAKTALCWDVHEKSRRQMD